jgi:hypothetical protein
LTASCSRLSADWWFVKPVLCGAQITEPSPVVNRLDAHAPRRLTESPIVTAQPEPVLELPSFPLSGEERDALIRVLYVVKDNWWLDEREEDVLRRLLEAVAPASEAGVSRLDSVA